MKKSEERASIKISMEAKNSLQFLSKRNQRSEVDFASQAILFAHRTGLDIYSKTVPDIPDMIKNLERRIIGFMKKREQDFFVPLNDKVAKMTDSHVQLFDALQEVDIINFAIKEQSEARDQKGPAFLVPEELQPSSQEPTMEQTPEEPPTTVEKEGHLGALEEKVEKLEDQKQLLKRELEFLYNSLSKSGALSGGRFSSNINQRDHERIGRILHDS